MNRIVTLRFPSGIGAGGKPAFVNKTNRDLPHRQIG
jgi:hypothetical protein